MQNHKQRILIIIVFACSGLCGFALSLYIHGINSISLNNDIPVVQTFHYPVTLVSQLAGDTHAGERIFKEFCATCHAKKPLIDIHAPRIGDKKAWQELRRSDNPTLLKITIKGIGAMPARGGCFECSDEQLQKTIQYMLNNSK